MRMYALRMQAEGSPEDVTKQTAFLSALLETGSKDYAKEAVQYYEEHCFKAPMLQDQKAFDLYLAGLAISTEGSAVQKLASASQKRDALLRNEALEEQSAVTEEAYVSSRSQARLPLLKHLQRI